jgi:bis(5'-nucleosidyl)-tetraphosphatase
MPERILSAGVVVVRREDAGWRVLLLRVYNYWDCPKGVVGPGEDPEQAAIREVREETGIAGLEFSWGKQFIETEPYSRNKVARYYLACTTDSHVKLPVNPELGVPEHHEWGWYSWDDAMRRVQPRLARVLGWARDQVTGPT